MHFHLKHLVLLGAFCNISVSSANIATMSCCFREERPALQSTTLCTPQNVYTRTDILTPRHLLCIYVFYLSKGGPCLRPSLIMHHSFAVAVTVTVGKPRVFVVIFACSYMCSFDYTTSDHTKVGGDGLSVLLRPGHKDRSQRSGEGAHRCTPGACRSLPLRLHNGHCFPIAFVCFGFHVFLHALCVCAFMCAFWLPGRFVRNHDQRAMLGYFGACAVIKPCKDNKGVHVASDVDCIKPLDSLVWHCLLVTKCAWSL
jgi:hypothetical protein